MSRPTRRSGSYGLMPATCWVVCRWKYSGTISTSPPSATTSTIRMIISHEFCSMKSWSSFTTRLRDRLPSDSCVHRGHGDRVLDRPTSAHGLPHVPAHHAHAAEIEHAAQQPHHVERERGLDALDERVSESSVVVDRAPHQSLHDARD